METHYTFSDDVIGLDLKAMLGIERTGHAVAFRRDPSARRSPTKAESWSPPQKDRDHAQD